MKIFSKLLPASKTTLVLTIISSAVLFALLGVITHEATKAEVTVNHNGETTQLRTHADTVGELLQTLEINTSEYDELSHPKDTALANGMEVDYQSAEPVHVVIDGEQKDYYTTADTVGEFFEEQDLHFKNRDEVSHTEKDPIEPGMNIEIAKAFQVTINDGGEKTKVWTTASTVGAFLNDQEIELGELDEMKPQASKQLTEKTPVKITRVEKVTDVVEEEIDFSVVTKQDSSIPKGERKTVTDGEKGLVTKKYEVTLKNGEEIDRKLIKEEQQKESQNKIVAIGTKEEEKKVVTQASNNTSKSSDSNNSTTKKSNTSNNDSDTTVSRGDSDSSAKTLQMSATAYTASCSGCSGITATGINLKANPDAKVIAVDPNVIPLGTRVWVEGYGNAIAGDTGGAINGNKIDLFMSSKSKAQSFGRKTVQVKILE
ncbi:hypothetical protein GCM10007216_38630 [Thalassobacillus devorans]|uniref:G5 domain-containing protein n=1 Tax=Thalassobacillus devorans TaxID=279813 RepID=A0ABQ1PUW5_9BACI|nr:G5 and 3D domain-containing protein [Thalassobacillus devorans]NIK30789.1 uncharacterized protein YabE (DUF348 family) [Thalassobacillus devorans]GGD04259.1 hypothetical protein GCM10007216_38630 [Thalassobacillus devorans]